MKIALTIPSGRPRVKQVVKSFIENAISYGYNPKDFSVYLSIDTKYQNTKKEDFKVDKETKSKLNKVEYIFEDERKKLGETIVKKYNTDPKTIKRLFIGRGYSKQRNSALFLAIKDNNDIAICIDDDEAPFIPVKRNNGEIEWRNLDFFGPHIKELISGTDITRGPYMGYQSPVPSDFENDVPEEIRIKLGEALELGSDVIKRKSFFNLMNQIKYLDENEILNPINSFIVEQGDYGKHIYAGNMGINLNSIRSGKIPIFYTPPNARGEDTIFALQLQNVIVKEVNSFIFHDPFDIYPKIFEGEFPENLRSIPVTEATKTRFINALIGWLKYAPILIYLTSENEIEQKRRINEMLNKIEEPTKELAKLFNRDELNDCLKILKKFHRNVNNHQNYLIEVQKEWRNNIIPSMNNEQMIIN